MANAGQAIFFVLLLAASLMVGVCVLTFAARCMLVAVGETAQGQDAITWPKEPFQDWLGHAALFLELLGIWVAPAALTARLLRHVWLPEDGLLRMLILIGPGLWLFFPVGLLSSLSAESQWTPFRWAIVQRMLRITPTTLAFYFLTALVLSAAAVPWYYALSPGGGMLLPVAAVVGAAVLFIYARLLGRFAWLISRVPVKQRVAPKAKVEAPKPPRGSGKKKRKRRLEVDDPWAVPEGERSPSKAKRFPGAKEPPPAKPKAAGYTPPRAEEIEPYGFATEEPAKTEPTPKKPVPSYLEIDDEPIPMLKAEGTGPAPPLETQSELFAEQVRQRLAERTRVVPTPPPHPFFSGVYTFPFYAQCFPSWFTLSLGLLVEGSLVYLMLDFGRTLFHW
jgi:hypothetical protein